tara:strand:+ start:2914 stop:3489 length:576 start_codon:yes stop_codon:yes gene_type:complete
MTRRRINSNEVRIPRTITVSPSFWERFKVWCRGRSMSEMIEMAAIRMMDEKNDVLSLSQQIEEINQTISEKKYDYKKLQVDIENDELNRSLLQERMAEMKSSEKALELQAKEDNEFMQMVVSDKLGMIRRSFPSWMHEEEERAAYMPSIDTVKERSTVLDKYNTVKTKMAWIALKFPEKDWEMWLKRETII